MRRARLAKLPPVVPDPRGERKFEHYAHVKARPNMARVDRLPPFERALVHFYGVDAVWSHLSADDNSRVPEELGRAEEFWSYWDEERKISEAKSPADDVAASIWGGILGR